MENIAIAVPLIDDKLLSRITVAQAELEANGTLPKIRKKWLGNPMPTRVRPCTDQPARPEYHTTRLVAE